MDWLPLAEPGAVGLTFAPGKRCPSGTGADWERDLASDLDRLVHHHRTEVLVSLIHEHELATYRIGPLWKAAAGRGIEVWRHPIDDGGVPERPDDLTPLARRVALAARDGRRVVIHCIGGLGRTGTLGACVLCSMGWSPGSAKEILKSLRGERCPETPAQRHFIDLFAKDCVVTEPLTPAMRIFGAVMGAAIGDALGHPTEFLSTSAIRARYGPSGVQGFQLWIPRVGGTGRAAPYTDDTQMAEIVLRTLVDARDGDEDLDTCMKRLARGFITWSNDPLGGHRGPGNACLAGCRRLAAGVPWQEAGGLEAGGCGSVMRAWPFGLVFSKDTARAEEWAVAHSRLTHRHPIALAASAALAVGTALLIEEGPLEVALLAMVTAASRWSEETASMIERAVSDGVACREAKRRGDDTAPMDAEVLDRLRGWAAHEAIAAAAFLLARFPDDPRAALLAGANATGDSDSIASIAGSLLGALHGLFALPGAWVMDVERSEELLALARRASGFGPDPS